jgi:RTX calcium-binding nonapeptide repeat (4 copies)/WD40-like Beta Propeller Repeat
LDFIAAATRRYARPTVTVRAGLLCLLVAAGVPAARAEAPPAAELSFTVRLHGNYAMAAICVATTTELPRARRMTGLSAEPTGAWSPDGRTLAVADGNPPHGGIRLVAADGRGQRIATRPRPNELDSAPTWSPDGTQIAFARYVFFARRADYRRMGVWMAAPGSRERQISTRFAGSLDWSPDGGLIAADLGGELNTYVDLLRPTGGRERTIRVGRDAPYEDGVSWSTDGTRLALGGGLIVDRSGNAGGRYAAPTGRDVVVRSPAWAPGSDTVAYVRAASWTAARTNVRVLGEGDLYLGSTAGGAPVRLTTTPQIDEATPAWRESANGASGRSQPCLLMGTARRDVLRGTGLDDLVDAGGGGDVVYGRAGDDFIAGGPGDDLLVGGPGRDALWGETGNDRFLARDHRSDSLLGGLGDDRASVDRRLDTVLGVERVLIARAHAKRRS